MHAYFLIEKSVPGVLLVLTSVFCVSVSVPDHVAVPVVASDVLNGYFMQCVL